MRSRILACLAAGIVHVALIALLARDGAIRDDQSTEETRTALVFLTQFDAKPAEPVAPSPGNTERSRKATKLASDSLGDSRTISQQGRLESPLPPRSPSIDWSRASELAAQRQVDAMEGARQRGDFTAHDAARNLAPPTPPPPEFHWDHSHTDRIEPIRGGTIIHLNDRCILVISGLIMPACSLGRIEARGDLFEHMHDTPQRGDAK